jgi:NAD-dependent dihydropyrimidine dehydrogenase PreA subunit
MATKVAPMAMFIAVEIDPKVMHDKELTRKLVEVCPVNIFAADAHGHATTIEGNLDECVLCELCVQAAPPKGLRVRKLYSGETLERQAQAL